MARLVPAVSVLLLAVGAGYYVVGLVREKLEYAKTLPAGSFNDGGCQLLPTAGAVEDFAPVDGDAAIGAASHFIEAIYGAGPAAVEGGGFLLINASEGSVRELRIDWRGLSSPPKLLTHGLHYSKASHRLYAVNHDVVGHGESVEIFDVMTNAAGPSYLSHVASVRAPGLFQHYALNDVVEGTDPTEFYVTEWLPFGAPVGGNKDPSKSFSDKLRSMAMVPINLLGLKYTRLFRCALDGARPGAWSCAVASTARFGMANGITASRDRQTYYVSDMTSKAVHVMRRDAATGALVGSFEIPTRHAVDNLEVVTEEGAGGPEVLTAGTCPLLHTSHVACGEGFGMSDGVVIDGRRVGCGTSPGSMLRIEVGESGASSAERDALVHDGTKLSGVSAAVPVGGRVLMGSASSPGVLLCGTGQ